MRFSVVVAPVLGALLFSACTASDDPIEGNQGEHAYAPPELPRLPSTPLGQLTHGATARVRAVETNVMPDGSARVSGNRRITQKVLLLGATGTEPAYLAAKAALDRLGVPYRALIAANELVTGPLLSDGISTCNYSAVIIGTSSLGYVDPSGAWASAMEPGEWQELADFEAACSAREVVWYGWPGAEFGLAPGAAFDSNAAVDAKLTVTAQNLFKHVKKTATIPYRHSYGYRATIADPTNTQALITTSDGSVLLATHTGVDGRESMISTVDSSPYLTHSIVLEYDFVRWVTRGMFVGQKRSYFAPQIDDLFLANDMWSTTLHANDPATQYRIVGNDLQSFAGWQTARKNGLPAGSTFKTYLAFNGVGTTTSEYTDTTLLTAARANASKLAWMNHTWDHENLDAMSKADARIEVSKNCQRAFALGFQGFNCAELVTPDMSGLGNANAIQGMLDAGVRFVVSDTSITEVLRPGNPGTNPSFNVGRYNPINARLYHVPRHPTSIFYDVSTPETETDEYNTIYRSYYGRDLSYAEILDKDSEFGLFYLLQGDVDPLMFHQANLRRYNPGALAARSIYGDWVDAVFTKYLAFFDAPVLTLTQAQIGNAMQARGKFDSCGLTATIVEGATARSLVLSATTGCTIPVTGLSAPFYGQVQTYAGDSTTSVVLGAGQVRTVPLPSTTATTPNPFGDF
ncbi:hypothetical protein BH11MYX3_BH11MYX3_20260 [soil metagenome]